MEETLISNPTELFSVMTLGIMFFALMFVYISWELYRAPTEDENNDME